MPGGILLKYQNKGKSSVVFLYSLEHLISVTHSASSFLPLPWQDTHAYARARAHTHQYTFDYILMITQTLLEKISP